MHSTTARRLLLLSLVGLSACAGLDPRDCGMAPVAQTAPVAREGNVRVQWIYGSEIRWDWYGEAISIGPGAVIIRMAGEPPRFNDVCALARLGHEVAHGMGASHEVKR
jgi:hypothetical protein